MKSIRKGDPVLIVMKDYGILYAGIFNDDVDSDEMNDEITVATATPDFCFGAKDLYFFDDVWCSDGVVQMQILDEDIFIYNDTYGHKAVYKSIKNRAYVWILYVVRQIPARTKKHATRTRK